VKTFLLDVNVLIALLDADHVNHRIATEWFLAEGSASWSSCPITENGVIRILGGARYPNGPGSPAMVADIFRKYRAMPGHVFWPDDISIMDEALIVGDRLLHASHLTDIYLLALARSKQGLLATFDKRIVTSPVRDGSSHLRHLG
jgi:toxin-antitoxin system PIN domain toxin